MHTKKLVKSFNNRKAYYEVVNNKSASSEKTEWIAILHTNIVNSNGAYNWKSSTKVDIYKQKLSNAIMHTKAITALTQFCDFFVAASCCLDVKMCRISSLVLVIQNRRSCQLCEWRKIITTRWGCFDATAILSWGWSELQIN